MDGRNTDMQTSRVQGVVILITNQEPLGNVSCNQPKEVIIYNGEDTELYVCRQYLYALQGAIPLSKVNNTFNMITSIAIQHML